MKSKLTVLLFLCAILQLQSQVRHGVETEKKSCASLVNIKQECNGDGTVTLSFQVSNNTTCKTSGVTITDDKGAGQSYPIILGAFMVSSQTVIHKAATPGSRVCFEIILHEASGRECCRTTFCIDVDCCDLPGCCDLNAELLFLGGCAPNARAQVKVTGGTPPYDGPGIQSGEIGNFIIHGLTGDDEELTFTDSGACAVQLIVTVPKILKAELINLGGCAPNARAQVRVTGGTQPYDGPGFQVGAAGNFIIHGLEGGDQVLRFTDGNDCKVELIVTVPEVIEASISLPGDCGQAAVTLTGGIAPYSGPGTQTTAGTFDLSLPSGPHDLIFMDSNGCDVQVAVSIPDELEASVTYPNNCGQPNVIITGGTAPYDGDGTQITPGTFAQSLSDGVHQLRFTDSNGCEITISVEVDEDALQGIIVDLEHASCANDGSVAIQIIGGTAPYDGPGIQNPSGVFTISYLSPDNYIREFTDSNGCKIFVSFTIENIGADCEDFISITADQSNDHPIYLKSAISATISITLDGKCVPDQVIVTVNDSVVVNLTAGSHDCDDDPIVTSEVESAEFCIIPCDEIVFTFFGDICPNPFVCGGPSTLWDFSVTACENKDDGSLRTADVLSFKNISEMETHQNYHEIGSNSLRVFPNPVSDVLNITNTDYSIEYQAARIFNSSGKVILTEKMSGQDHLQIDARAFPKGIYFIELTGDYGYRIVEQFTKLQ